MGQRLGDPYTSGMQPFTPSTPGWPGFTRVNPVLGWQYHHVWRFLRGCSLPYCRLYDQGYTSLGEAAATKPNVALLSEDGSHYRPAHELVDGDLERRSRSPTSARSREDAEDTAWSNNGKNGRGREGSGSDRGVARGRGWQPQ
ncbi:unnamed protein product, partial [Discosporangium mesarthrocarpum]